MTDFLFALALALIFGIGVFQILRRDLIKAALGYGMLLTGVNLFFIAAGAFRGEAPAYTTFVEEGITTSDPLVQALVLTAVVVGFGSFATLLALINMAGRRYGTVDSDEVTHLKN